MARGYGARGASVALLARGEDGLDAAAEDVRNAGGKALAISTDTADFDQVSKAADAAQHAFGPIDIWVNDAFSSVFAPFDEITPRGVPAHHGGQLPRLRLRHAGRVGPDETP